MEDNDKQTAKVGHLKQWLDAIQQESWQLELLISGFVLFLLTSGYQPIVELEYDLLLFLDTDREYGVLEAAYYLLRTGYLSLILCLILHVIMRGLWIAAVGLRSVSGEIDYEALRFQDRFLNRLQRRLGSFDDYIARLERNCSVIFSLAFLIIFCFISLVTWFVSVFLVFEFFAWLFNLNGDGDYSSVGVGIVGTVTTVAGVLYLIDFVTLGFFKRNRWTARPYYYLYVVMGWVTLARFYRPLYYNLIDNSFGRKLALVLPIIVLGLLLAVSVKHTRYDFFPYLIGDGKVWLDANNYDDEDGNPFDRRWRMSLSSRYARNNYVQVFVPYRPKQHNPRLRLIDSTITPSQYVGFRLHGAFKIGEWFNSAADDKKTLAAFSRMYKVYVNDSLYTDLKPLFHYHTEREQAGLSYMIPVHELPPGRHELLLKTQVISNDTLAWFGGRVIYFYK